MDKIRIAIADDHAVLRSGLKAILNDHPQFEVIAEASNGLETLAILDQCCPDVLILDLAMPGMSGIDCIKEIRNRGISCRILVLTMHVEEVYVKEVMRAGADGYVLKKSADTDLVEGILTVHSGKKYINEFLAENMLNNFIRAPIETPEPTRDPYFILSAREREVLRYLAQGYTNSEIGKILSLSGKTIDTYRSRIMQKLDIHRKSELVNFAIQYKLLQLQSK